MLKKWNHLHIARICVEAETPLSIQTGQSDLNYDSALVRDANGLPALPSTSIRGVIRHLSIDELGEDETKELFGYAQMHKEDTEDKTSRIQVSWGVIHDSQDKPVEGLSFTQQDPGFLGKLAQPQLIKRERVKLNHRGTAEENDAGKFDISLCPKGTRFTFELKYWSDKQEPEKWIKILQLLQHPNFRLGNSTKSGLGALKVKRLQHAHFNFKDLSAVSRWQQLPRSLDLNQSQTILEEMSLHQVETTNTITIKLQLAAEGFVRIGGGDLPMYKSENGETADLRMQSETYIEWLNNKGQFSNQRRAILPASSFKGAFTHRLLYHANRLNGKFADRLSEEDFNLSTKRSSHEDLVKLLGVEKSAEHQGQAGKLILDDLFFDPSTPTQQLWHNKIDRFTGGVIDGALYSEEVLFEPRANLTLTILDSRHLSPHVREALKATVNDLCNGLLAIGAGSSRGLGSFTGKYDWQENLADNEEQEKGAA